MTSQQRLFDVLRNRVGPTKVYGRDEELGLLQDAFDRVAEDECQSSEVVLVHGPSGCGKSAVSSRSGGRSVRVRSAVPAVAPGSSR